MKKTDFNTKFMIDEGKTFAEWKEWVRKAKPTQAKAHVVQATLKNGKKFDRVYGSYVDAQNNAFALKQQLGAKNVKMFTSVNGGPLKLERSFDSAVEFDAAMGIKIPDNEKGTERTTMEKVFKELSLANAWKKVKKGNTIVIRTNINGKDQDVAIIQYFNPNTVSITPRKGTPNMVSLKNASVMAAKMGVEGRRSYNDSADEFAGDASVATFTVKSNRNGSKYGYIEKICKTEAEAKALVDKLKKDGFVAMYKKVMYRDSADTLDRVKAKYCLDGPGYNFYDLKTALSNGDIKPTQRMVSYIGGGMAKTAKEWLDMGAKVVNANRPYPLDKIKKR